MAILKAFKGIRPTKDKAALLASRPYDVLNSEEAFIEAEGNPYSFLHVVKPEIDLPSDTNHYSMEVYLKGKENFEKLMRDGILFSDPSDCLYIYQVRMNGRKQNGIVGCAAVEDYMNNVILKHELTRPDKEEDRKNHVRISNIHAEPVFFAYKSHEELDNFIWNIVNTSLPEYDFTTEDGIGHSLWVIQDEKEIENIIRLFSELKNTYVADGHHRTAAAALVGNERKKNNPNHQGNEEYNFFLAVHFPDQQLQIMDYNRVVKDLNGHSTESLLIELEKNFDISEKGKDIYKPNALHDFGMYLEGKWYSLKAKVGTYNDNDPIGVLDVTILSEKILSPILNIKDLRTDKRIDFVGGMRGLEELEKRVNSGEMKLAFALYPVSMKQLIDIADSNNIMPPKTTWFEPKLRSGLVIHSLE